MSNGQGIEKLVALCIRRWGAVNLGTYSNRDKRGKKGNKSVHALYRAADVRFVTEKDRNAAFDWFTGPAAEALKIDCVVDYAYTKRDKLGRKAYGRAWNCEKGTHTLSKGDVEGGGQAWANWLHIEIGLSDVSENSTAFSSAWRSVPKP